MAAEVMLLHGDSALPIKGSKTKEEMEDFVRNVLRIKGAGVERTGDGNWRVVEGKKTPFKKVPIKVLSGPGAKSLPARKAPAKKAVAKKSPAKKPARRR